MTPTLAAHSSNRDEAVASVLRAAASASQEVAHSDLFYRQLALHLARDATSEFQKAWDKRGTDAATAVASYVSHEEDHGRLGRKDIEVKGRGFDVDAKVHQCPYQRTCQTNLQALGEVPQCIQAITLIQAMTAKMPERPPIRYDLEPGLVDGKSDACSIQLRPVVAPNLQTFRR